MIKFKWRRQGSKPNCGAVAASVLLDVPVKLTTELVGYCKKGYLKRYSGAPIPVMRDLFRLFGVKLSRDIVPYLPNGAMIHEKFGIAILGSPKMKRMSASHWVAIANGRVYDGAHKGKKWPRRWCCLHFYRVL